jgi:hypothetical protein
LVGKAVGAITLLGELALLFLATFILLPGKFSRLSPVGLGVMAILSRQAAVGEEVALSI